MDNRCPYCGEDLLNVGITHQLSKSQKIISHWIDKMPMECNSCHGHFEKNEHKAEGEFRLLLILFYVTYWALGHKKIITESSVWWVAIAMFVALVVIKKAVYFKLNVWPRYKKFEPQTQKEKIAGYIVTIIFYSLFIGLPLLFVWAIFFVKR